MVRIVKRSRGDSLSAGIVDVLAGGDRWHSGEELARVFGVSRAAIGKHVAGLRKAGHIIEASTNKGYFLLVKYEPVDREIVHNHLRTRIIGKSGWRTLSETTSTNNDAIAWALADAPAGSIVTAEKQTHGKGRIGHEWFSSIHGLQFSIILRPKVIDEPALVKHMLSAISKAIEMRAAVRSTIKEPNDLLAGGKKIAGVLAESGRRGNEIDWLVLGAGCNVNVPLHAFPDGIREKSTSIHEASGRFTGKSLLLADILNGFEKSAGKLIR